MSPAARISPSASAGRCWASRSRPRAEPQHRGGLRAAHVEHVERAEHRSAASSSPCSTNESARIAPASLRYSSSGARPPASSTDRASPSAPCRSPRRSSSQARWARLVVNSTGSPVRRALGHAGVERDLRLLVRVGPDQRHARLGEPRQVGRLGYHPRPGGERALRERGAGRGRLVAVHGDQRGHAEDLAGAPGSSAARRIACSRDAMAGAVAASSMPALRASDSSSCFAGPPASVSRAAARSTTSTRRADLVGPRQHVREHERGAEPGAVVAGRGQRLAQPGLAVGLAGGGLGDAELEQDLGADLGRRRLGQRAAQVGRGRLGCAAPRGGARRLGQQLDGPRVAARCAGDQVLGDALVAAVARGEQLGCAAVRAQRARRAAPPRARPRARSDARTRAGWRGSNTPAPTRRSTASAAVTRSMPARSAAWCRCAGLEHGDGAGEPDGGRRQAAEAQQDRCGRASARRAHRPAAALSAVGSTSSSRIADSSSRTRNGRPPVARWQAVAKDGAGSRRARPRSAARPPAPTAATAAGCTAVAVGEQRAEHAAGAPARTAGARRPRARARAPPAAAAGRRGSAARRGRPSGRRRP